MDNCITWLLPFITVLGVFIANAALILPMFFWLRGEANADRRDFYQIMNSERKDMMELVKNIQDEVKDFHNRLCIIEERQKIK